MALIYTDPLIRLRRSEINRVNERKTLGIVVDDQLMWKNHISATILKASKGIGMIRRMKAYMSVTCTLIHVYNAIILSHFDYCRLLWDNSSNYLIESYK